MSTADGARLVRGLLIALACLCLVAGGCRSQPSLSKADVDTRVQEYFQRGMELYQRGEFRPALESFRIAKAYDSSGSNPSIAEMIEKSEARLRINNPSAVAAPAVGAAPIPTPRPTTEGPFKTFHSRQYPYSVELPESWTLDPSGAKVANTPADLLVAPRSGSVRTSLTVVAHLLPADVDGRGYLETNLKLLRSQGVQPDEVGRRVVDGFDASLYRAKLSNEQFVAKAPEEVLAEQREKRAEAAALAVRLTDAIGRLAQ